VDDKDKKIDYFVGHAKKLQEFLPWMALLLL
jgi:hypothetical protein